MPSVRRSCAPCHASSQCASPACTRATPPISHGTHYLRFRKFDGIDGNMVCKYDWETLETAVIGPHGLDDEQDF